MKTSDNRNCDTYLIPCPSQIREGTRNLTKITLSPFGHTVPYPDIIMTPKSPLSSDPERYGPFIQAHSASQNLTLGKSNKCPQTN